MSRRREHLLNRLLVIVYAIISLALVIFTGVARDHYFTSNPCLFDVTGRRTETILINLLFIPYAAVVYLAILLATNLNNSGAIAFALFMLPFLIVILSLVVAVLRRRHSLPTEYKAQSNRWKFWVMWCVAFSLFQPRRDVTDFQGRDSGALPIPALLWRVLRPDDILDLRQ